MTPISAFRTWIPTAFAALALMAAAATPAQAETKTFRAVSTSSSTAVFKIRGLSADEVRRALARVQRRDGSRVVRRVSASKLRAAIARGKLRVRSTGGVRGGVLRVSYRRKRPTVDTTAPETTITSGPTGTISTSSASLAFSSSESAATFQCQVDAAGWNSCSNPKTYSGLSDGSHAVAVRATDAAGNTDASPATRSFTVDTTPAPDPDPDPTPDPEPDPDPTPTTCDLVAALTTPAFGAPSCWRPYSDSSFWNRKVPASAPKLSNSAQIIDRWVGFGDLNAPKFNAAADTSYDYDHAIYYSKPTDPLYTVSCTQWVSSCEVHGDRIRIPSGAKPAEGGDGHMTVIDLASGTEYDFWQVASKPSGGGTMTVSHGGETQIDGDGMGTAATAAHYGLAAGVIRPEELQAGEINHALFMVVNCTGGKVGTSAGTGRLCSSIGQSNTNAPRMGEHLVLDMTEAEINALPTSEWRKTILHAMREYGLIIGDTGGGMLKIQSGTSWTSLGLADKWGSVARSFGISAGSDPQGPVYRFDMRTTIDWKSQMKVVDPCVSTGTC